MSLRFFASLYTLILVIAALFLVLELPTAGQAESLDPAENQPWPAPGEFLILPDSSGSSASEKPSQSENNPQNVQASPSPEPLPAPLPTQGLPTPPTKVTPSPEFQIQKPEKPSYNAYLEPFFPYQTAPVLPTLMPTPVVTPTPVDLPRAALDLDPETQLLLPDLVTLPPYDLRVVVDPANNRKIIRFSNAIANLGLGPLELQGDLDGSTGIIKVMQHIYLSDDNVITAPVGEFFFQRSHNHWHWEGFSLYEVWSTNSEAELVDLLYSSDKVGYCLRDDALAVSIWQEASEILQTDELGGREYLSCGWGKQGLSVGWTDVYRHNTPGQFVDVSGLEDGIYALRSVADPHAIIYELNKEHNEAIVYFRMEGNRILELEL